MAINLQKIQSDLNHGDPQIQTFALMSITRLSPQLVDSVQEIQAVYDKLQSLVKSTNPDVVFLARKATNHIDTVFRPYFKELGKQEGGPPRDPREMDREELLRTIDTSLEDKYVASLVMRFIDVGQREDLSALRPYLEHNDDRVRSNAVEVFEALGSSENVEDVKPLLHDRNNRVRGNAIMALVKLGFTDVRRNIEEMLCMGMISMRETAVYVLSQLKLPFVEELLIKASADPYDGVRLRATKALGNFITRRAIVRLKQLMNDIDINICEAAVESLRSIKRTHEELKAQRQGVQAPPPAPAPVAAPVAPAPVPQEEEEGNEVAAPPPASPPPAPPLPETVVPETSAPGPVAQEEGNEVAAPPQPPPATFIDEAEAVPDSLDEEIVAPAEPEPLPAPPRAGSKEAQRSEVLRELGTEIYQLCRMNEITHESLDNVFYEILRYQDFLRAYLVKKQKGATSEVNPRAAIEQLQSKIKDAFAELGLCASDLLDKGKLKLPEAHAESIEGLIGQLKNFG